MEEIPTERSSWRRIAHYFLRGAVITLPVVLTVWIAWEAVTEPAGAAPWPSDRAGDGLTLTRPFPFADAACPLSFGRGPVVMGAMPAPAEPDGRRIRI